MKAYFTKTMEYKRPEPRHKLCSQIGLVTLQQRGIDNFLVRYGRQVEAGLSYGEACGKLGQALMHQLACDGALDNREPGER